MVTHQYLTWRKTYSIYAKVKIRMRSLVEER